MPTIQIIVKGEVQGVFYRVNAQKIARKEGITGWVRNVENGNVEMVANGSPSQLNTFIEWCGKGPEKAKVAEVLVKNLDQQEFDDFNIKRH